MNYDMIIIGSGLGGLFAGAKLAKEGRKVLLVEQHDRPGGCATTFERKDFTMEVGLHEMDGLHPKDMKNRIFRDLGVSENVTFLKVPEFYRFVNSRYDVVISHNPEDVKEKLYKLFPAEKAGIDAYFHQVQNIKTILKENRDKPEKTLGEFMDSIISDEDLKLILLGNLGYYHDNPYELSLSYYSVAQNSYYAGGGNFIRGGSQVMSDYLMNFITANGGTVLLNHIVTEIIVENGTAVGIRYKSTKKSSSEIFSAGANEVIANASVPQVASRLIDKKYGDLLMENIKDLKPGPSLLTVYFGFNKKLSEIGNRNYSTFIYDESVKSIKDILPNNHTGFDRRSFTFVDYSQIDSQLAGGGRGVGAVCCNDYVQDWENLSKDEYRRRKEEVAMHFINRLDRLLPGFKDAVEYYEVGTAKTVKQYTLNPEGAVYGFAQTPVRVKTVIKNPVKNLSFASAWSQTGGGFSGAIFSGYLCALDVLRRWR